MDFDPRFLKFGQILESVAKTVTAEAILKWGTTSRAEGWRIGADVVKFRVM